jgi:hypothetical protein
MIAAAPGLAAVVLVWLAASGFDLRSVVAAAFSLPAIVFLAPSATELGLSMAIEAPIVWALFAALRLHRWRSALASLFVNGLTQPLLHLALVGLAAATVRSWWTAFAVGETLVWLGEALLYLASLPDLRRSRAALAKALGVSLAANAASAAVGLLAPA